jgi:hypothetical protein
MDERRDLVSVRAPGVIAEVDRVRAILAPTGKDLEALLIALHRQSAQSQRKARKSQQKARDELYRRLEGQVVEVDSTGTVMVMPVTTRELIGMMEAESNLIKVESMSQRSYTVHRVVARAANPQGGSLEEFIGRLEEEEATEAPDLEPPADR